MATHSNILAWKIPWTEKPCGLESIALQSRDMTEWLYFHFWSFPHRSASKVSACKAGDPDSFPELGRSPGEGNGNLLQYYFLENPIWTKEPGRLQSMGSQVLDKTQQLNHRSLSSQTWASHIWVPRCGLLGGKSWEMYRMSSSAVTLGVTPRQRNSELQATGQAQVWHMSVTGTFLCLGSEGCVCVCVCA